ncbi:hypothetical protein BKA65DRAFT_18961 [Rhexocercosporidium sp. MPI-PUGE-AT-0058]|nr:hypothetical protein BKA65DRAFT_18961 [Rhexocercosporidium sp. MPI-PUGE-AT-0058]
MLTRADKSSTCNTYTQRCTNVARYGIGCKSTGGASTRISRDRKSVGSDPELPFADSLGPRMIGTKVQMLLKEKWSISRGNPYLYIHRFSLFFTVGVSLIYLGKPTPDGRSRKLIHSSLSEPVAHNSEVYSCAAYAGQSIEEIESIVPLDTLVAYASGMIQ